jgi:hypothetical protein
MEAPVDVECEEIMIMYDVRYNEESCHNLQRFYKNLEPRS